MIITIAGQIGVGKSTVGQALAARLGVRYVSAGEVFREMARERSISVLELNRLAERDPALDRELDRMQAELARAGPCVLESRLAGWMVPEADLKVWLHAALTIRAARVAGREGMPVAAAERDLREREASEWQRYRMLYGIDINDLSPYHLVLDSGPWSAEVIVEVLALLAARQEQPERSAGAAGSGGERR